jgi:outer membrane protein OmpA-like peptidoglycan-associated protein
MTRKPIAIALVILVGVSFGSGCATKKYVRQRIDERVAPIEGRTGELEETSRRNSADIQRLGTEVADARGRADRAQESATAAQTTANDAVSRADTANRRVGELDEKVENLDAYSLQRSVSVNFKLSRWQLDEAAMAVLDDLAAQLKGKKGYVLEIQGFTDATGSDRRNRDLSERRARAVWQYLAEHHEIPLHRMNLLGLGEGRPVAENDTREGRAQNRRVEVRIYVTAISDVGGAAS